MSVRALTDAFARNQVVIITGTGVTAALADGAPTSTWVGLLDDGVRRIEALDPDRGALLRLRLDTFTDAEPGKARVSDLTNLATELRQEFASGEPNRFNRWLSSTVGALQVESHVLARAIAALASPILTTNYDTLLEESLSRSSASWTQPDLMRAIVTGGSGVGHLHGIHSDADNIVFSEQDYVRVLADPAAQALQTSAFTMKTFVFVGFGAGTDDPNFRMMIDNFGQAFRGTTGAHYRLCRTQDVRPGSDLEPVTDVAYGDNYSDLPDFLSQLVPDQSIRDIVDLRARSFRDLESRVRDNSTLWRDADSLEEKTIYELVVEPIFLPEPHDQYASSAVVDDKKERIEPIEVASLLNEHDVILVAGEENSGVTTALVWTLNHALKSDVSLHSIVIDDPVGAGSNPIRKRLDRHYRDAGFEVWEETLTHGVMALDNLRFDQSERFKRAVTYLGTLRTHKTIIGVRQQDALDIATSLTDAGAQNVKIAYLGRFSNIEANELARRLSPGSENKLVHAVMIVIREKRLPRNPFTITLLLELIRNGSAMKDEESEIAVLDKYVDLLLAGEFFRTRGRDELTLRSKRLVLVTLARKLVERKEDRAPQSDYITWVEQLFAELNWPYDAMSCLNDLIRRRVLGKGADNSIRFQRSAYLELMAGLAAQEDDEFRELVFSAPLELASIVRTYAAMNRTSADVLNLMVDQLGLITDTPLTGSVFAGVRQRPATDTLFNEPGESTTDHEVEAVQQPIPLQNKRYYDVTDDRDVPAFLVARIEDLPPGRVAALVIDLASRVLRDTDEIRDQNLKGSLLKKVLVGWVRYLDLFENDLRTHPELEDTIRRLFIEDDKKFDDEDVAASKAMVLKVAPSFLTLSGISYCLAGPSLVPLLQQVDIRHGEIDEFSAIIRTLTLYKSGSTAWVPSLKQIGPRAKKTWFSASFLSSIVRYAYIVDTRLSADDREEIREFLRDSIDIRYTFTGVAAKNKAMNSFENSLRQSLLKETRQPTREITVLD